ncbi:MAG: hypothetical protein IJR58_04085, partial [Lachnospiraceae bacterium]|nr:hypothetical protein [Lachnospiraceae bacterium]
MKKKMVAVVLLMTMLAGISACGRNEEGASGSNSGGASSGNNTSGTMPEEAKQYVFKDEVMSLKGDEGLRDVYQMVYDGTNLYTSGSVYDEETHLSYTKLYRLSTSGEVMDAYDLPVPEGRHANYGNFQPCKLGGVIAVKTTYNVLTREEALARQEEIEAMESGEDVNTEEASDEEAGEEASDEVQNGEAEETDTDTASSAPGEAPGTEEAPSPEEEDPERPKEEDWYDPLDYSS